MAKDTYGRSRIPGPSFLFLRTKTTTKTTTFFFFQTIFPFVSPPIFIILVTLSVDDMLHGDSKPPTLKTVSP